MAQLLSNLPIGAKVKFGKHSVNGETALPITWLVVAKNHSGYVSDSVTLYAEKIIDFRAFDAAEPNHADADVKTKGFNDYALSNINSWLNSATTSWYNPLHGTDTPPDNVNVTSGTGYVERPGFLYNFTENERNAIMSNSIYIISNGTSVKFTTKVFLPTSKEIGMNLNGESVPCEKWSYFLTNECGSGATQQACDYTLLINKPLNGQAHPYWTRTHNTFWCKYLVTVSNGIGASQFTPSDGSVGVRPALNLSSFVLVSDTMDSDGCYAVILNIAPPTPQTINIPMLYGGKSNVITWSSVVDPNGDTVTYQLECSIDGGEYTPIYSGLPTVYAHLVPFGASTISYRVKATDTLNESSTYTTSPVTNVINNNAPVISGADGNLGIKSDDFTGTYTITDANNNTVTVTEAIDGVQIRALVATLGQAITYGVTGNTWLALSNGSHTLTISATDGIDTTVRTYVFTKLANALKIQNSTPWVSSTMPSRIMLVVTRNIPSAATFKVEVCNNGYDASPTWEDCTDAVRSGLVHVFANTKKTATNWGVLMRVTVDRNGATGACYVSAIGGNFE